MSVRAILILLGLAQICGSVGLMYNTASISNILAFQGVQLDINQKQAEKIKALEHEVQQLKEK